MVLLRPTEDIVEGRLEQLASGRLSDRLFRLAVSREVLVGLSVSERGLRYDAHRMGTAGSGLFAGSHVTRPQFGTGCASCRYEGCTVAGVFCAVTHGAGIFLWAALMASGLGAVFGSADMV